MNLDRFVGVVCLISALPVSFRAEANIISVTQVGTALDPLAPLIEPLPLGEESFIYVDRNHELTAARFAPATGLLTTDAATGTLAPFPSYLSGIQYVSNANDNRAAGVAGDGNSYVVTYTVDTPSTAYLLLDNRLNGTAGSWTKPNSTDPDLGGSLAWVTSEGWTRVNTGFMPNGQADYVGLDEGGTVANADARNHHDPGAGVGLNNFFAIYQKTVNGSFETKAIRQAAGNGNMYVVGVAAIPEPGTVTLLLLGFAAMAQRKFRKR